MPKRHSKGGMSSANVVPMTPFVDWNSPALHTQISETSKAGDATPSNLTLSQEMKPAFGNWTKDTARQLTSHPTAFETWLITQAYSIHQRKWTLEEAILLFNHVDIVSRQPLDATVPKPPRFARALRALRAVLGTVLLGMGLAGCTNTTDPYISVCVDSYVTYQPMVIPHTSCPKTCYTYTTVTIVPITHCRKWESQPNPDYKA